MKNLYLICFLNLFINVSLAQKVLTISFEPNNQVFEYQKNFSDSAQRAIYLQSFFHKIQKKGYGQARLQEIKPSKDSLKVLIFLGKQFFWKQIEQGNVESIFLEKIKLSAFQKTILDWEVWEKTAKKITENAENKGYPFAKISLDSLEIEENQVSAKLKMQKGFFVAWDTLSLQGNVKLKRSFLEKYLQIIKGEPFSQKTLQKAEKKLKNLGFVRLIKP
ncbi:MAG: POTRA domain-containing protein, partial [Raineya sp.]